MQETRFYIVEFRSRSSNTWGPWRNYVITSRKTALADAKYLRGQGHQVRITEYTP